MPLNYTKTCLTKVQAELNKEPLPEITFPQFIAVDNERLVGFDNKKHLTISGSGTTDGGLISANTTTFDSVDIDFGEKTTTIRGWMKTVGWNTFELEKAKNCGVDVTKEKMKHLNEVANLTIQKVAFIGHEDDVRITGLLNSKEVKVINSVNASAVGIDMSKPLKDMNCEQAIEWFGKAFELVIEQSDEVVKPNTVAIDGSDRRYLATLRNIRGETALDLIEADLSELAEQEVKVKGIPQGFAKKVEDGVSRVVIYNKNPKFAIMDIPLAPTIVEADKVGLVNIQTGMRAEFGGVCFKNERTAMYFDLPLVGAKKSKK